MARGGRRARGDRESADAAKLRLRGADGTERALWFLREREGWTLDDYRTSMPR